MNNNNNILDQPYKHIYGNYSQKYCIKKFFNKKTEDNLKNFIKALDIKEEFINKFLDKYSNNHDNLILFMNYVDEYNYTLRKKYNNYLHIITFQDIINALIKIDNSENAESLKKILNENKDEIFEIIKGYKKIVDHVKTTPYWNEYMNT